MYATGSRCACPTREQPGLASIASGAVDVGPVMVVPLTGRPEVTGVLTVARPHGRAAFTTDDLDMTAGFANQASVAIELADARAEQQRCAMDDERDRIAADLHDHVIQRLFATGLALQSIAATPPLGPGPGSATAARHHRHHPRPRRHDRARSAPASSRCTTWPNPRPGACAARLLDVITEVTPVLGFTPAFRVDGPVDSLPDPAEDLLAVLREALSNIARHAHAHTTDIDITGRPSGSPSTSTTTAPASATPPAAAA